jgi:hypothetical protein
MGVFMIDYRVRANSAATSPEPTRISAVTRLRKASPEVGVVVQELDDQMQMTSN